MIHSDQNLRRLTVLIFLITALFSQLFAQGPGPTRERLIGYSWYDFIEGQGRKVAHALDNGNDGIHFIFLQQPPATGLFNVTYDWYDISSDFFFGNQTIGSGIGSTLANSLNDAAMITYTDQGNAILVQDVGESNYFFQVIQSISNSSAYGVSRYAGTTVFSASPVNNLLQDSLRISYDNQTNWFGASFPVPDPLTTNYNTRAVPIINPQNPQEFSFLLAPDAAASAPNGSLLRITSSDSGATWIRKRIHNDDTTYFGNTTYAVEDFADINGIYDSQGNWHVVAGAVQGLDNQGGPIFPILHWNSNSSKPIELTDDFYGRNPDSTVQDGLINLRPGNGLGNAYPQIARFENDYLAIVWQQWESNPDGSLRTVVGSAGEEVFVTDIWGCILSATNPLEPVPWKIAGIEGVSDMYPRLPETLEIRSGTEDSLIIEFAYMRDSDPGVSVLGQNNPSQVEWIYARSSYVLPFATVNSNHTELKPDEYSLEQNYPNPFNPSTTISYSLRKRGQVTIDVYNITGGKVTTLVNQVKPAGEHSTQFTAENLPSGLYFYTISSNGIRLDSKKMILIK